MLQYVAVCSSSFQDFLKRLPLWGMSRRLKIIGLFCKRVPLKRRYSAKETYNFKEPTNRSYLIPTWCVAECCSVLQCSMFQHIAICCSVLQFFQGTADVPVSTKMVRCRVLQCVAVCCSVLQSVAECCRVLQGVVECCSVLQSVAECCRVLPSVAECCRVLQSVAECCRVLQSVAECCRVLQCGVLQSVAV